MPSGKVHDRIALYSVPVVSFASGVLAVALQRPSLPIIITGAFLFSGLMMGPDLDTYPSNHYKRWFWFRRIWHPYRWMVPRHRHWSSHGFAIGTTLRLAYLLLWISLAVLGHFALLSAFQVRQDIWLLVQAGDWQTGFRLGLECGKRAIAGLLGVWSFGYNAIALHQVEAIAFWGGLELGAMLHYVADAFVSEFNRRKIQ